MKAANTGVLCKWLDYPPQTCYTFKWEGMRFSELKQKKPILRRISKYDKASIQEGQELLLLPAFLYAVFLLPRNPVLAIERTQLFGNDHAAIGLLELLHDGGH